MTIHEKYSKSDALMHPIRTIKDRGFVSRVPLETDAGLSKDDVGVVGLNKALRIKIATDNAVIIQERIPLPVVQNGIYRWDYWLNRHDIVGSNNEGYILREKINQSPATKDRLVWRPRKSERTSGTLRRAR